jgi:hypothetical protein
VAAIIKRERGVDVTLTAGGRGEFTVWLDGKKLLDIEDDPDHDFPDEAAVLRALRSAA